ncbi:pRL2-8 [Streptomyces sp. CC224B]|uniref:pRL2-8 n=1 Tax=Streptomyces sp. CC224B TaxID=3044571 RepID=UPI0024A943BC|nr:pRL2-8 [Streptomyces sp. CC224B]
MSKARAANPPPGECRQCWQHAEDPDAHRHLGFFEDCLECIACAATNHGNGTKIVPKKPSIWI